MANFIDVSGYSYTGKGAVIALLREFESTYVTPPGVEFYLIRGGAGLFELRNALVENWSLIRSDLAIKNYLELVDVLSNDRAHIFNIKSLFKPTGQCYEKYFPGFREYNIRFIESLTQFKDNTEWPFEQFYQSSLQAFVQKWINLFNIANKPTVRFSMPSASHFDMQVNDLFNNMFSSSGLSKYDNIVLNNALEPMNSYNKLEILKSFKLIIVDRDPRDVYVAMVNNNKIKPYDKTSLSNYINRYKQQRLDNITIEHSRVIRIQYEELLINYHDTVSTLSHFLSTNIRKSIQHAFFDPNKSIKNIALWKEYKDRAAISAIENKLTDYIVQ